MRRYDCVRKKICRFMFRYVNGTKGVISIFLAILMLPFASIGGILINAARVNSAVAVFDEALCNASNSTLGTYDSFLRTRFGFLAMSQNTSSHGVDYTVQDLIAETFEFYMEQNTAALSNTYVEMNAKALGIYPLADTGILFSQILEYGKYTIPAKLAMDGLCIDKIIESLSEEMGLVKSFFKTISSAESTGQKITACKQKINTAIDKLGIFETKKSEYTVSYKKLEEAVNQYNNLLDEMKEKIKECESDISDVNEDIEGYSDAIDEEAERYPEISSEWDALKNEKDVNGNPVDNNEALKKFEDEHKELKDYIHAQEMLEEAQKDLETANDNLNNIIEEYQKKLDAQRGVVENSRAFYCSAIEEYAESVKEAGDAVVGAQEAYAAAFNAGVGLITNLANTWYEGQKELTDIHIKDMEDNNAPKDQINQAKINKNVLSNSNTLVKATSAAGTKVINTLDQFCTENYATKFNALYLELIELKVNVEEYTIVNGYETKMPGISKCYDGSIIDPLTKMEVEYLLENLGSDIAKSTCTAYVKAVISFIKAMFSFSAWVDLELSSTIDVAVYDDIGGLPSSKDRSEGSPYCLKSEYDTDDSRKSEQYKQLLSSYSSGTTIYGSGMDTDSIIKQILDDIDSLLKCFDFSDWHWYNIFDKLVITVNTVTDFVKHVIAFLDNGFASMVDSVYQRLLLVGYIAYNIPNRTTYTGSALTGSSYKLPNSASNLQGYAFYGAETEYIIKGHYSEATNQKEVYNNIWLIRFLFNCVFAFQSNEVMNIVQLGFSIPIIGFLVGPAIFLLYAVAEGFMDTFVLVNGGDIPIWKTIIYLTPSGIKDLVKKITKLKLPESKKSTVYDKAVEVVGQENVSEKAPMFAEASVEGKKSPFTFDYTKTLLLIMLFENQEKMLDRLADVIQMEASYYAASPSLNGIGTYTFNLDESYTYLRSSGSFTTNAFMPISDFSGLKTNESIIYRGY